MPASVRSFVFRQTILRTSGPHLPYATARKGFFSSLLDAGPNLLRSTHIHLTTPLD